MLKTMLKTVLLLSVFCCDAEEFTDSLYSRDCNGDPVVQHTSPGGRCSKMSDEYLEAYRVEGETHLGYVEARDGTGSIFYFGCWASTQSKCEQLLNDLAGSPDFEAACWEQPTDRCVSQVLYIWCVL